MQNNFFIESRHFMKKEKTQLKTKQLKQNIFKSMGIYCMGFRKLYCLFIYEQNFKVEELRIDMADFSDKTINDVNNYTVINTTKSVDEEQILQFILSTIEEQKPKKKGTCKSDIFKLCKENFSENINDHNFFRAYEYAIETRKSN